MNFEAIVLWFDRYDGKGCVKLLQGDLVVGYKELVFGYYALGDQEVKTGDAVTVDVRMFDDTPYVERLRKC